jgi:aspartate/methionine/tyrosine aminotransferase
MSPWTSKKGLRLAERMSRLGTESAFDVLVRARALEAAGQQIIHLEIGEPDFPTAPHIVEAGVKALRDGYTHYGPPAGLPQLREAIAEDAAQRGLTVDPSQVVVTPGAKPIMFYAMLALVEAGDEVLYPDPGFPIYESMINFVGGRGVPYTLTESRQFDVTADEILEKITPQTRLLILNSPQNPTGGVLSRSQVEALARGLADGEMMVLSDEIYRHLIYEGEHVSIAQFPGMQEKTIILDGFSKGYAMTGWRLGYGIMRQDLADHFARLMVNSNSCTASFSQMAGVAALRGSQDCVTAIREEFRRRRKVIIDGLNRIPGFQCQQSPGAFYAFPNITGTGKSAKHIADALLEDAGVACLSGTAFGKAGEGHLRFSYANSIENIQLALQQIEDWAGRNVRT